MLRNYLKTALRTLRGDKTYTLLNVTGLALGLAGGLVIFLFVQFHLGTDAFHPAADRTYRVVLDIHSPDGSVEHEPGVALAVPKALQTHFAAIRQTASLLYLPNVTLTARQPGREPESFLEAGGVAFADAALTNLFAYSFSAGDKRTALRAPGAAALSENQARKYFGTTDVLGRTLRINQAVDVKVTGVFRDLPANTDLKAAVLLSMPTLKMLKPNFPTEHFGAIGSAHLGFIQLPAGYDHRQLEAQLPGFRQKYQGPGMRHWHYRLLPLREMHFDERYGGYLRKPLLSALGLVGVFLVTIACINFVNLTTAGSLRRLKEVGVRKAIGGTRRQLFWQFITEAALLTGLATGLALGLAALLLPRVGSWINTPLSLNVRDNPLLLPFVGGLALLVAFGAGSYPALVLSGYQPMRALRGNPAAPRPGGLPLRRVLVGVQLVLSQAFIVGALVVMQQVQYFRRADPGFAREGVLLLKSATTDRTPGQIRQQLLGLAEVAGVSFHFDPPMVNSTDAGYVRFDRRGKFEPFLVRDRAGDAHYLDLYGLPLVAGRNFTERDSATEFVVNEELVRRLGIRNPGQVLGRHLYNNNAELAGTIVGVVRDFHHQSLQRALEPLVLYPLPRIHRRIAVKLRTADLPGTLRKVEAAWRSAHPGEVFTYEFLDDNLAKLYAKEETLLRLTRLFTGVAIFICCLGFYGLVLFMANRKTKEIGIRKVLGATLGDILLLFGREFFTLIGISFVVAAPLAGWVMHRWLAGFAYRVPVGWGIFALTGLLTLVIVLLTVGYRSLRAALADPVKSLRSE